MDVMYVSQRLARLQTGHRMNFWLDHSIWFLLGLMFLPRITLLLFAVTPFGWLAWLG
jgi:hypothetical protein